MTIAWVNDAVSGNFRGGERTEYSVDSGACKFDIPDDSPDRGDARGARRPFRASINSAICTHRKQDAPQVSNSRKRDDRKPVPASCSFFKEENT